MLKAQILLSWKKTIEGNEPVITLQPGDSAMDVTGQLAEKVIPDPNLTLWELWTDDLTPYESDAGIHIISSVTLNKAGEITENQPRKIDPDEAEKMRLYFVKVGMKQSEIDTITEGSVVDRDYEELTDTVKEQLKILPKKKAVERIS